jgi:hypothetical protein
MIKNKFLYLIFGILILSTNIIFAQFTNNFWVFGDCCLIKWNGTLAPSTNYSSIIGRGTVASISDSGAVLLSSQTSYTNMIFNNTKTFNKYGISISGSDSIIGEGWYHEMVILPFPDSDSLAYIFSIGVTVPQNFGLYYTLINYKANNDTGIVIQKNVQLNNFPAFDGLTAVRHGNGRDWWLVFQRWDPVNFTGLNDFYIYEINSLGINVNIQNIGPFHTTGGGQTVFNNNGFELLNLDWRGLLCKFSFDRCSGILSNPIIIETERLGTSYPYFVSGVYSPDDSKLYVMADTRSTMFGTVDTLYQYDLNATNINGSKQVIYSHPTAYVAGGALKLAPDGKIYLASADESASVPYPDSLYTIYNTHLSVINQPDSLGLACDFQPFSFYLGGARTYYGPPNNPDYELGAWVGSPCDTLTVGQAENGEKNDVFFQAWYNHEWNMIHVNAAKLKGKSGVLRLFDVEGRVVYERKVDVIHGGYFTTEIGMSGITAGVYIVSLTTEKDKVQGKVLKF